MSETIEKCDYCGRPAVQVVKLLSGEPVNLCDAGDCHDRYSEISELEYFEFMDLGIIPPLARDA
ncbi:MAG: hypothetical protein ABW104_18065 [Candidatus Thiodiazotropha sp. 6PLUC2]|nr:hypothetical protein [Candidatus Thiodiazotropha lotti]MCW4218799.1 hypothetical protein [Candidatus Thiodiazotropha lotti]